MTRRLNAGRLQVAPVRGSRRRSQQFSGAAGVMPQGSTAKGPCRLGADLGCLAVKAVDHVPCGRDVRPEPESAGPARRRVGGQQPGQGAPPDVLELQPVADEVPHASDGRSALLLQKNAATESGAPPVTSSY